MCAPANTPATPPNFPDTLLQLSKMSTKVGQPEVSPSGVVAHNPFAVRHKRSSGGGLFTNYNGMGGKNS